MEVSGRARGTIILVLRGKVTFLKQRHNPTACTSTISIPTATLDNFGDVKVAFKTDVSGLHC